MWNDAPESTMRLDTGEAGLATGGAPAGLALRSARKGHGMEAAVGLAGPWWSVAWRRRSDEGDGMEVATAIMVASLRAAEGRRDGARNTVA